MPLGRWVPAHTHRAAAEAWHVLEGELTFRFGARTETAPAGSFVFVPAGVVHEFGNAGPAPARFLEFFVPGGSEGYHLERAALEQAQRAGDAGQYSTLDAEP
jgi:quercetin dioxygenase-like cupin family protein